MPITRLIVVAAALIAIAPVPASSQVRTADPVKRGIALTEFPRVVKLADHVYGYEDIRAPGFTTVSLFVVGKNGVLVADGQGSVAATQKMLDMIKGITPLPIKWYVVGSDHGDHTGGNSVLPKDVQYIVHPTSKAALKFDSTVAAVTRTSVDVGGMKVEVMFLGRAHTGGDLSVYLPAQKILFMSEAYLNRVFPAMRSAFPSEWVKTVDAALAMDVQRYVPGHGFIETPAVSREELVTFRAALVAVIAEVTRLHKLGLSVDDAIKQANWGEHKDWLLAEQQAPIAVRKVYDELDGKLR